MKKLALVGVIGVFLASSSCWAFDNMVITCVGNMCGQSSLYGSQPYFYEGDGDLSKAMNICEGHSHSTGIIYMEGGSPPNEYDKGWEPCYDIRQKWNEGMQAKAIKEAQEKAVQD